MKKTIILSGVFFLYFLFGNSGSMFGQSSGSDSLTVQEKIDAIFPEDLLNFGGVVQAQSEVHWDPDASGDNTFRIPTARLQAYGKLGSDFSYFFETDITASPSILEAHIGWHLNKVTLRAGAMKPKLSQEFILFTNVTDMINRSRIVAALAGQRDIGVTADYAFTPSFSANVGMFNGTGQLETNNNNTFLYTGRLNYERSFSKDLLFRAAVGGSHGIENGTVIGDGTLPAVFGNRTVLDADVRLEVNRFILSSEFLYGELEYEFGVQDNVTGFHLTGGYVLFPSTTLLLRLDHIDSDEITIPVQDQVLGAISHNFNSTTNFQFNYLLNPDDFAFSNQYWLAQIQFGF